jgi:hypothetical protein
LAVVVLAVGSAPVVSLGQLDEAWVIFVDSITGDECGIVNAANAELVVLAESGNMVVVSGSDVVLADLVVDQFNQVSYLGEPAGIIDFADDGDGLPAVFWTTLAGTVVTINTFTGEPADSGRFPDEFRSTGCDECLLIDESVFCEEPDSGDTSNGGEVVDPFEDPLAYLCGSGSGLAAALSMILVPFVRLLPRRR